MAKTPPASAAAPVLDEAVDLPGAEDAAPGRWSGLTGLFRRPFAKLALQKKTLIIVAAVVLAVSGAGVAAYAFWPAEPERPASKKAKAKRVKPAASAPVAAVAVDPADSAASGAEVASAAAPPPAEVRTQAPAAAPPATPAHAASASEDPMDKLRRRLGEAMGGGALQADSPGELRLTARTASPAAAGATRTPAVARHAEGSADAQGTPPDKPRRARSHAGSAASTGHVHWSYEGPGGPEAWGKLKPEYATCSSGQRQSPIDLRDGIQVQLEPIRFEYQPSPFGVIDNGHTVQVNVAPGNFIETMGRRFHLQQFHFHRPSEERIDGRQSDMAAHLVHQDAEGRLAIVAVLLERGSAQPVVQTVWNNLPLEKGQEQPAQVGIDLNQLLPAERGYFTYMGSMTTPPCSEGVLWMVMKQPVPISAGQLSIFARLYPMNARPVQPAAGRIIKESGGAP